MALVKVLSRNLELLCEYCHLVGKRGKDGVQTGAKVPV